jgi:hypothetical protein
MGGDREARHAVLHPADPVAQLLHGGCVRTRVRSLSRVLLPCERESGNHLSMIEHMFDPVNREWAKCADFAQTGTTAP